MDIENIRKKSSEKKFNFCGMGVAIITPFKEDFSIDFDSLSRLIEYLIKSKADYIVVLGTTAETPTLSANERESIRRFVVNKVAGRVPLVLGLGGNCTKHLIDEIRTLDLSGYNALLSVTPFYNKPNQEGLYRHFSEVAKASSLPIILYNVPGRTGVNLEAETTLRLARENENIVAIKEASGDIGQAERIIQEKPGHFKVLSGDDGLTFKLLKAGASGVISVIGNAFPAEFGKMVGLCLQNKFDEAEEIDKRLSLLYEALFADGNPGGIKCLLAEKGLAENRLRLPLVPVNLATEESIRQIIENL